MNTEAAQLLQKLLNDNNLEIKFADPRVRATTDGAVIVESPQLLVEFAKKDTKFFADLEPLNTQAPKSNEQTNG